jgi:hypothetical protein
MVSFLGRDLAPSFALRVLVLDPGCFEACHPADWQDTLVVVEQGQLALSDCVFRRGAVLTLSGLDLRRLHNPGLTPTILTAVYRRSTIHEVADYVASADI